MTWVLFVLAAYLAGRWFVVRILSEAEAERRRLSEGYAEVRDIR